MDIFVKKNKTFIKDQFVCRETTGLWITSIKGSGNEISKKTFEISFKKLVWKEILDYFIKTKLRRKCMHEIYLRCSQFLLFCISKCAFHLSQFNTHPLVVKLNKHNQNDMTPSLNQEFWFKAGVEIAGCWLVHLLRL